MIIAVPLSANRFSTHFGGADAFCLYSVDSATRGVTSKNVMKPPEHSHGAFPLWLRQQGVTVVLAGGMGPKASTMLQSFGIEVHLGVTESDPNSAVEQFMAGTLETSGELCHDHNLHNCGHHN